MKRHSHLWEGLVSFRNLTQAAHKAARGKRGNPSVQRFLFHLETELCRIEDQLRAQVWVPGEYRTFEVHEPKRRMISAAPFRDRVVHHALCNILEPIFERSFSDDSFACRRGKGTHAAIQRFQSYARQHRYVLKCDLRKFFPSVDHDILKATIRHKIKDPQVLWLVDQIIDGSNPQEPMLAWFPGDSLLTPSEHQRGLPIGNQTSLFFANALLNPFDHFAKEVLRAPGYVRYVDDFAIFHDDKQWLGEARQRCVAYLADYRLKLHPKKSVIARVEDGCRFLGFRVFPGRCLLPRENVQRMRRRLRTMQAAFAAGDVDLASIRQRLMSWIGHASHAESELLRADLFDSTVFSRTAEEPWF